VARLRGVKVCASNPCVQIAAGWSGQEAEGVVQGCMGEGQSQWKHGPVTALPPLLILWSY